MNEGSTIGIMQATVITRSDTMNNVTWTCEHLNDYNLTVFNYMLYDKIEITHHLLFNDPRIYML